MNDVCDLNVKICMQVAKVLWQQIWFILALMIFLVKFLLKSASKSSFFRFGVEIRFWSCKIAAICGAVVRNSIRQRSSQLQLQA